MNIKAIAINPTTVKITFTRTLPKNLNELAQMIANLSGKVSTKTLIEQLPFVEDAESEVAKVEEENEKAVERQQKMFAGQNNMSFNAGGEEDENSDDKDKGPDDSSDNQDDKQNS